jgi:glycosyltransferase involved in cell wall biosynthesis
MTNPPFHSPGRRPRSASSQSSPRSRKKSKPIVDVPYALATGALQSVTTPAALPLGPAGASPERYGLPVAPQPWPTRPPTWQPGRPLQAIHVGPCFFRGGAEQHLLDLARHLHPDRVQLTQAIVTDATLIDGQVARHAPFPVVHGGASEIRQAARDADLLLYWGLPLQEFLPERSSAICVYLAHGDSPWTRDLLLASVNAVDHAIAVSERVERRTCAGIDVPCTRILNGVDTARLSTTAPRNEIRRSLGFRPDEFVLGYVGRFAVEKRPWLLIEAVELLPPEFKALLVGWGHLQADLFEQANARIPGRFACLRLDGYLGDAYAAMDAFCLTSDHEGFALVLLEAMHCGVPVIATPVGAVPEFFVDRVNGQIVDGSPAEIAAAARRLRDHPQWARGLAEEGRTRADAVGHASRMAVEYETLFERLWMTKRGTLAG